MPGTRYQYKSVLVTCQDENELPGAPPLQVVPGVQGPGERGDILRHRGVAGIGHTWGEGWGYFSQTTYDYMLSHI